MAISWHSSLVVVRFGAQLSTVTASLPLRRVKNFMLKNALSTKPSSRQKRMMRKKSKQNL